MGDLSRTSHLDPAFLWNMAIYSTQNVAHLLGQVRLKIVCPNFTPMHSLLCVGREPQNKRSPNSHKPCMVVKKSLNHSNK
jgi:hypothetical protein